VRQDKNQNDEYRQGSAYRQIKVQPVTVHRHTVMNQRYFSMAQAVATSDPKSFGQGA
jgi:hypothetical protein